MTIILNVIFETFYEGKQTHIYLGLFHRCRRWILSINMGSIIFKTPKSLKSNDGIATSANPKCCTNHGYCYKVNASFLLAISVNQTSLMLHIGLFIIYFFEFNGCHSYDCSSLFVVNLIFLWVLSFKNCMGKQ